MNIYINNVPDLSTMRNTFHVKNLHKKMDQFLSTIKIFKDLLLRMFNPLLCNVVKWSDTL